MDLSRINRKRLIVVKLQAPWEAANVGYFDPSETFDIASSNKYVSELRKCGPDEN